MQAKLHQWATTDPGRRFYDLFNLVCHPDFLTVAWDRVSGNKGARTAGVDRVTPALIAVSPDIVAAFLADAREQLKSRTFTPLPVRERMIPKSGQPGKVETVGYTDHDGQAGAGLTGAGPGADLRGGLQAGQLRLPTSQAGPGRDRRDPPVRHQGLSLGVRGRHHGVLRRDLAHHAFLERVGRRIGDKRVLALVKAFLKAGIMSEAGQVRDPGTGTPQGGISTPPTQWATRRIGHPPCRCLLRAGCCR